MTSEQNPEVESHQGLTMSPGQQDGEANFTPQTVQHGMGQSKSSRRRRRKRKNKGADVQQGAQQPGGDQSAGQSVASIQGAAAPQSSHQQNFQPSGGQQQQNGSSSPWESRGKNQTGIAASEETVSSCTRTDVFLLLLAAT